MGYGTHTIKVKPYLYRDNYKYVFVYWDDGTTSNVRTLTVKNDIVLRAYWDRPPNTPSAPSGPTIGYTGTSYTYSTSTTDPDGDSVCYQFDWGDGSTTTTDYYSSGSTVYASHTWSRTGTYNVKVRAKSSHGAWSGWSSSLITISGNRGGGGGGGPLPKPV